MITPFSDLRQYPEAAALDRHAALLLRPADEPETRGQGAAHVVRASSHEGLASAKYNGEIYFLVLSERDAPKAHDAGVNLQLPSAMVESDRADWVTHGDACRAEL
jgi:hypothetical protein